MYTNDLWVRFTHISLNKLIWINYINIFIYFNNLHHIPKTTPFTYKIRDYKNETIDGIFYEEELQKCKYPGTYLIERVIEKWGDHLFVKWLGFDDTHNQWIHRNDLWNIFMYVRK